MELISTNVTTKNSSGSWDVTIGSAASGDVIVVAIALSSSANVGSGFTTAGYTARGGSMNPNMLFYTKTAGASEPTTVNCTVSSFANAFAVAMIWRGCSVDSASSTFNTVASTTTKTHTAPTITPTADQSVVLSIGYFNNSYLSPALETVSPLVNYTSSSSQIMVATQWIETAAASTAFAWESTQTSAQTGNFGCIVLNNTSGQPRYIGCTNTHERIIKPYGYGVLHTFAAPNVLQGGAAYNGVRAWGTSDKKSTTRTVLPNSWLNGGISLFDNATTNNMSGTVVDFTGSLQDLDGKLLGIAWTVGTSQWTASTVGAYGLVLSFEDNAGHADHYKLGDTSTAFLSQTQVSFFSVGSRTPDVNYGGTVDYANIKYVGLTYDKTTTAAPTITMSALYAYSGATVFVGGGSSAPIDAEAIYNGLAGYLGYSGEVAAIQNGRFQGASQLVASIPIQIGDGTIPTYLDLSLQSIDTPRLENRLDDYDCAVGLSGITLYTSSSDTVNLASALIGSVSRQYFKFHASAVEPSSFLAAGATISNRDVTWLTGLACPAMTFDHCYAVDMKDADCTGTVWKSPQDPTTSTFCAASWTVDGATLTGTETDVSGTSADYHIALGASVTAITLTNHTFTGTAATDKIYVAATTGTVTITISGTTSLVAGDVTSAGATVVIAAPEPTLDATVLANSRVLLYNDTTAAELDNTAPAGTSWSKTITSGATAGDTLTLWVFKEGYEEFSTSFLYTGDDQTILVTQVVHEHIDAMRTTLGITDYTTITEYALDTTGTVEIDADDADGSTLKKRLAVWYNGILTTADGATYLRGAISVLATNQIRINVDVLDLLVENVSATYGLNFTDTDVRLWRSDGTPIYKAASAPGSIQNDYSGVPDTVETGVSGLTGAESSALTDTAATIAARLDATISSRATPADVPSANDVAQEVVNGITF